MDRQCLRHKDRATGMNSRRIQIETPNSRIPGISSFDEMPKAIHIFFYCYSFISMLKAEGVNFKIFDAAD